MQIFNLSTSHVMKCVPSSYNSGVITLFLRDELKDTTVLVPHDGVFYQNFQLYINFSNFQTVEGQSFEVEIKEDDELIYRGKAYATAQTDFNEFELNKGILKV